MTLVFRISMEFIIFSIRFFWIFIVFFSIGPTNCVSRGHHLNQSFLAFLHPWQHGSDGLELVQICPFSADLPLNSNFDVQPSLEIDGGDWAEYWQENATKRSINLKPLIIC